MNLAIFSPSQDAYSETFIQAHRTYIKADNLFYIYGKSFQNLYVENIGLLIHSRKQLFLKGFAKLTNQNFNYILEKQVAKRLKELKVEVALVEYGNHAMSFVDVFKRANIPFVVHFHGYDASVKQLIEENNNYKKLFDAARFVVAVSRLMEQRLLKIGCPKDKLVYNVYGANPIFSKRKPKFLYKQAIAVGRFVDKKAPYYTILAFQKVVKKHKDVKLIMAGDGFLRNTCQNLINYLGLENNVKLVGVVSPEKVLKLMEESHCFVQHSITAENGNQEGTPVAVLEASLLGLPVVSTYHAGIQDVIVHEQTGLLCKEHDVDKMSENLLRIFDDLDFAKKLGKKAREVHLEKFSLDRHIKVLEDLLIKAIQSE